MASANVDVDEKAARRAAQDRYWDHHRRQRQCGIPFRDDWVPWGRLWWVTLDACRDWYRAANAASAVKIDRAHPHLQRYTQALAYLKNQHWANWSWYNGTETMMIGSLYSWGYALLATGIAGSLSFPATTWTVLGFLNGAIRHAGPLGHASVTWQLILWGIAVLGWGNIARHAFATWWVAGFPWWPAAQRVERLLQRCGKQTGKEPFHE